MNDEKWRKLFKNWLTLVTRTYIIPKKNPTECREEFNNLNDQIQIPTSTTDDKDRELSIEICLTSQFFKKIECDFETENDDIIDMKEELNSETGEDKRLISEVIEEESLRYIGGYVVKKFALKYPHLGVKATEANGNENSWLCAINRGGLYAPTDYFMSQLSPLREIFIAAHGDSLRAGKNCIKSLISDMELLEVDVPKDVIAFFAKISVYFRMRHLNRAIIIEKKKKKECRSMKRKFLKL